MSDRFDPESLSPEAAVALRTLLQRGRYFQSLSLPEPGRERDIPVEVLVLLRFLSGGVNSFNRSLSSRLYEAVLNWRNGRGPVALHDLFWLHRAVPRETLERLVDRAALGTLEMAGILQAADGRVTSAAHCFPFEDVWILFDLDRHRQDFVYFGFDSILMTEVVRKLSMGRVFERTLDLCTGSGVQGLFLARRSGEALCADINGRAVSFVRANARLNGMSNVEAIQSDLFTNVKGRFDCILANTPYVPKPLEPDTSDLPLRGGDLGVELSMRILAEVPDRLTPDGVAFIYTSDPLSERRRHLLDHVASALGETRMCVQQILLFRNYPRAESLRRHYERHGITAYDDCLLMLQHDKQRRVERRIWRRGYYWRTCMRQYFM